MAKKKNVDAETDELFSELFASGGESLEDKGKVKYFIDTGSLALNYMSSGKFIGGGFPGSKITEIYGPPGTSKTLVGMGCLAGCQRMGGISILLDCERASNPDFAHKAGHVDTQKLVVYEPDTIEEVERKIFAVVKKIREKRSAEVPICLLWDSIAVSPTDREWREIDLPEEFTDAQYKSIVGGNEQPGERAKRAGALLRKVNPFLSNNNATLLVINQVRDKIGVLFGSPETVAGGGKSLEFYISTRFRTSKKKVIESKSGLPLGVNVAFENKKSRSSTPYLSSTGIQLFFSAGINPLGGLLSVLLAAERIENKGPGNYQVKEPWSGGREYTFRSSKERNDVPVDLLLSCPKIIDASSKEEVVEYLKTFQEAINLASGESIIEKDVKEEDQ